MPIKEVDIANVKVGQRAEIKTDATGDETFAGEVESVSPAAKKGGDLYLKHNLKIHKVSLRSKLRCRF